MKKTDRYFLGTIGIKNKHFELIADTFEDLLEVMNVYYMIHFNNGLDVTLTEVTKDEYLDSLAPLN